MSLRTPAPRPRLTAPSSVTLLTSIGTANLNPAAPADWQHGIVVPPSDCGNIAGHGWDRAGCAQTDQQWVDNGRSRQRNVDPITLTATASCSSGGGDVLVETQDRAREMLDIMTPYGVEHELWTGSLAQAAQLGEPHSDGLVPADGNRWLASTDATVLTTGTTGVSPLAVVGLLEEALGAFPGLSLIHAGQRAASFLAFAATRNGNRLETKLGTVIVPGMGYASTGPDGTAAPAGTAWVYGTGQVTVRLTPVELMAEGAPNVDRAVNTVTVTAQRDAMVDFDGCAHFAALMTLKND